MKCSNLMRIVSLTALVVGCGVHPDAGLDASDSAGEVNLALDTPSLSTSYPEGVVLERTHDLGNGSYELSAVCTGALLAPQVVLTSGICVNSEFPAGELHVVAPLVSANPVPASSYKYLTSEQGADRNVALIFLSAPINAPTYAKLGVNAYEGDSVTTLGRAAGRDTRTSNLWQTDRVARNMLPVSFDVGDDRLDSGDPGGPNYLKGTHTILGVSYVTVGVSDTQTWIETSRINSALATELTSIAASKGFVIQTDDSRPPSEKTPVFKLFEEPNYMGASLTYYDCNSRGQLLGWNDRVSSVQILQSGCALALFADVNYEGASVTCKGSSCASLAALAFDDMASSFIAAPSTPEVAGSGGVGGGSAGTSSGGLAGAPGVAPAGGSAGGATPSMGGTTPSIGGIAPSTGGTPSGAVPAATGGGGSPSGSAATVDDTNPDGKKQSSGCSVAVTAWTDDAPLEVGWLLILAGGLRARRKRARK